MAIEGQQQDAHVTNEVRKLRFCKIGTDQGRSIVYPSTLHDSRPLLRSFSPRPKNPLMKNNLGSYVYGYYLPKMISVSYMHGWRKQMSSSTEQRKEDRW
jgi:hypothetical protein